MLPCLGMVENVYVYPRRQFLEGFTRNVTSGERHLVLKTSFSAIYSCLPLELRILYQVSVLFALKLNAIKQDPLKRYT